MAKHKLWMDDGTGNLSPANYCDLLIYAEAQSSPAEGPEGDPQTVIPLIALLEAYNTVHGTDYTNY